MPVPELPLYPGSAPNPCFVLGGAGYATHGLGRGRLHIRGHVELVVTDSDSGRFRVELGRPTATKSLLLMGSTPRNLR